VDVGGSELRPVAEAGTLVQATSSQGLFQQAVAFLLQILFGAAPGAANPSPPADPAPGPTTPTQKTSGVDPPNAPPGPGSSDGVKLVWAVRIIVQLILMFLGTRTNPKTVKHSDNAKLLLPGINDVLTYGGAIDETDSRIFKKVNFQDLTEQRDMLVLLREVWRMFMVAANSIDGGIAQIEQFLDGSARFIYSKLSSDLGGDLLLQSDLQALVDLINSSILAGNQTRKSNQRDGAGEETGQEPGGTTPPAETPPPGGVNLTVTTPGAVATATGPAAGQTAPAPAHTKKKNTHLTAKPASQSTRSGAGRGTRGTKRT
jgi:hypothetical protein